NNINKHITEFTLDNNTFNVDEVVRSPINGIEGGWILDNVLSPSECQLIVDRIWSDNSDQEYKKLGIRVIRTSEELATSLTARIVKHLPGKFETYSPSIKQTIEWSLTGLSHRHRFIRYDQGQEFPTHMDGPYNQSDRDTSYLTCLFFLNEYGVDFEGGDLSFVENDSAASAVQPSAPGDTYATKTITTLHPKTGRVVIFPHKLLHTSSPITKGHKFLIRNDIMYKC
ncbi:hypothetical protein SAMD00019534_025070, partial [Acytostelium subglobosum LB1]|uniref:hypothetical protein n=1 Tax=Acytostelium subglobosum LB1 TaxID=1410327 RepID=UPI000644A664